MAKKKSEGGGGVPLPSKKTQEKSTRLIVSILYIILGISTILNVFDAFVNLFKGQTDGMTATILTFTVGILMALAGVFSLFRLQKTARAWIGVLIFIVALVNMILTVIQFSGLSIKSMLSVRKKVFGSTPFSKGVAGCRAESPKKRIRRETLQKVPK